MKILHTSDWHLGQKFMGQSRAKEHAGFFAWLVKLIRQEAVDLLIVSGDIFDTQTPPNYALKLYFNLLKELSAFADLTVIIVAGNHDSIATLNAPKALLAKMNIFIVASGEEPDNERIIPIYKDRELQGVVCAVPFLRDRVIRKASVAQRPEAREVALGQGIKSHYYDLYQKAIALCGDLKVPIIATGHLTVVGSRVGDAEREIYIGRDLSLDSEFLGTHFDYMALGHMHTNQKVRLEHVCYSGSPIPLSFLEAKESKWVNMVEFQGEDRQIKSIEIPQFQKLMRLEGGLEFLERSLNEIEDKNSWIELILTDSNPLFANQYLREQAEKLGLTILAIKVNRVYKDLSLDDAEVEGLESLTPLEIFGRRLAQEALDEEEAQLLRLHFKAVLDEVSLR